MISRGVISSVCWLFLILSIILVSTPTHHSKPIGQSPTMHNPRIPSAERFPTKPIKWIEPTITYFYQGSNSSFVLSWDDARTTDYNLAPIDEKYGISHTIFSPSDRSYPNSSHWRYAYLLDELFQGYDVQSHCGSHVHLSQPPYNTNQEYYVKWGKTGIEELFGFTPVAYAYPFGDTGGSSYVKQYFKLGRTIGSGGTSWPPSSWHLAGATIGGHGINDRNLNQIVDHMNEIYHTPGYQVFKGYGHTNKPGETYGVTDWGTYESVIAQIAGWENVWYTSWGELVAYTVEKDQMIIDTPIYTAESIHFNVTAAPALNTNVYNIPITISIPIPKEWEEPLPQIDGKFTSRFSLKELTDSRELFLDVSPNHNTSKITIWRDAPIIDLSPPEISNFSIETKSVKQSRDPWELLNFTFMRFDVTDDLSNVHKVNASIHLTDGRIWNYSQMENPIFWRNSTYGRVVWDSTVNNYIQTQVNASEVAYTAVTVQDGFGNTRFSTIYPNGTRREHSIVGNSSLLRFPDKTSSKYFGTTLSDPNVSYPNGRETVIGSTTIQWTTTTDPLGHNITYSLFYSGDSGITWVTLTSGLTTTSYEWNTNTVADGSNYLIKVVANCTEGLTAEDTSDSAFAIRNTIHSLSTPTIFNPNGGETLNGMITVNWSMSTDSSQHEVTYAIQYSSNNGATWNTLTSGLTTNSYDWDTTIVADGTTYLIKVIVKCTEGFETEKISDNIFTIKNAASGTTTPLTSSTTSQSSTPSWSFPLILVAFIVNVLLKKFKKKSG